MIEHYLIGMDLQMNGRPTRVHAYVMAADKQQVMLVTNKMVDYVEKNYGPPPLTMVLQTKLDPKTAASIRAELGERHEEARKKFDEATDFHCTMWEMAIADPWDEVLWGLH